MVSKRITSVAPCLDVTGHEHLRLKKEVSTYNLTVRNRRLREYLFTRIVHLQRVEELRVVRGVLTVRGKHLSGNLILVHVLES